MRYAQHYYNTFHFRIKLHLLSIMNSNYYEILVICGQNTASIGPLAIVKGFILKLRFACGQKEQVILQSFLKECKFA